MLMEGVKNATLKEISLKRTCLCGQVKAQHINLEVTLMGWANTYRNLGKLLFIDLRDRSGLVQITLDTEQIPLAKDVREEYVIAIQGKVQQRPEDMKNPKLPTGDLEVAASHLTILSKSQPIPFQADEPPENQQNSKASQTETSSTTQMHVTDQTRLKYRYIDLRRPQIQQNLILRHRFYQEVRKYLCQQNFLEVETPILSKNTPEGARNYFVPSRISKGHFYALVQSPQTFKQLLMVSGFDRYFQIAKCFRDEDLRSDRQPEFTQIDIEMSFVDRDDVMSLTEGMIFKLWKTLLGTEVSSPILQMPYQEAMDRFGTDRPDIRFDLELHDLTFVIKAINEQITNVRLFEGVLSKKNGVFKGLLVPHQPLLEQLTSRSQIDKLGKKIIQMGGKGLIWIKQDMQGHFKSSISKIVSEEHLQKIFEHLGGKPRDVAFLIGDDWEKACLLLGWIRLDFAQKLKLIDKDEFKFLWVTDFPLLQYDAPSQRWMASHHPFTSPNDKSEKLLLSGETSKNMLSKGYDLVCNGCEIAGGSIRIHRSDVQQRLFEVLGLTDQYIQDNFGFFIQALQYGTPPHGGIALGVDRILMLLCKTDNIRDVIAFPKTTKGTCLMSDTPSRLESDQLDELGLGLSPVIK